MKKLFSFVAVLLLAVSASATVLWSEEFGELAQKQDGVGWPYAGGNPAKNYVYTDYSNVYDTVMSYNVTVRAKSVNSDQETKYNGFYFKKEKAEAQNYVQMDKAEGLVTGTGMYFCFDFMSDQTDVVNLDNLVFKINGNKVTVPTGIQTSAKYYTKTVSIAIPDGNVTSIYMAVNNNANEIFMLNVRIEDVPAAVENVFENVKATKTIENGQVVIIRNGVKYNTVGAVIE